MISRFVFLITESFKGLFRAKLQAFISSVTIAQLNFLQLHITHILISLITHLN